MDGWARQGARDKTTMSWPGRRRVLPVAKLEPAQPVVRTRGELSHFQRVELLWEKAAAARQQAARLREATLPKECKSSERVDAGRRCKDAMGAEDRREDKEGPVASRSVEGRGHIADGEVDHDTTRAKVLAIYEQHNPTKVGDIDSLLEKYKGQWPRMLKRLEDKYVTESNLPFAQGKGPQCYMDIEIGREYVGRLVFELFADKAPLAVENFQVLCTGEKGRGFRYEGSSFHRILAGQIVQGGDFTTGDGRGGRSIYGGKFKDEAFMRHHKVGLLSMANSGPNTNSSQFFITLKALPHLDGKHVVFGEMVSGVDTLDRMKAVKIEGPKASGRPRPENKVIIVACGQLADRDAHSLPLTVPNEKSSDAGSGPVAQSSSKGPALGTGAPTSSGSKAGIGAQPFSSRGSGSGLAFGSAFGTALSSRSTFGARGTIPTLINTNASSSVGEHKASVAEMGSDKGFVSSTQPSALVSVFAADFAASVNIKEEDSKGSAATMDEEVVTEDDLVAEEAKAGEDKRDEEEGKEKKGENKDHKKEEAAGGGFAALLKSQAGGWKCEACLVSNPESALKCMSCETVKAGEEGKVGIGGGNSGVGVGSIGAGGFTFGVGNRSAGSIGSGSFKFGGSSSSLAEPPAASDAVSSEDGGFRFGASKPSSPLQTQPDALNGGIDVTSGAGFKFDGSASTVEEIINEPLKVNIVQGGNDDEDKQDEDSSSETEGSEGEGVTEEDELEEERAKVESTFDTLDTKQQGWMEEDDFENLMTSLGTTYSVDAHRPKLLALCKGGHLGRDEFVSWYLQWLFDSDDDEEEDEAEVEGGAREEGFAALLKNQAGGWKCEVCLVSNPESALKCMSCETVKAGEEGKVGIGGGNNGVGVGGSIGAGGFTFGVGNGSAGRIGSGGFTFERGTGKEVSERLDSEISSDLGCEDRMACNNNSEGVDLRNDLLPGETQATIRR